MSGIIISDDKTKFPVEKAIELLHTTYWAEKRDPEVIRKSIENSIVFGVYSEDSLIGMARVITDFATTFYLADVIIDEKYRGNGIGKKLISTIVSDNRFSSLLGILVTKDAHGLYEHFGFKRDTERAMTRRV
ncbi:Acetyltransferase (GNAT) family protein [Treponema bryantii]|uniref:Acetyltransferase (GNAT) family protein n=1 Tax=Treponema bryantii TaxID=163 RepID=A0A1H9FWI9_9SPIR|nr:GNAT family N-acetyltransferase [Treponema bryantii]SEQ42271.1 Acetyltransferase (GNAT) family protein [Treponema bryantii]